jgi:hypothetical protein
MPTKKNQTEKKPTAKRNRPSRAKPGAIKGRPKIEYTEELGIEICETIASSSMSVREMSEMNAHWPGHDTIFRWMHYIPHFSDLYAKAKRRQAEFLVDELLYTSRTTRSRDEAAINRLIVDTNKWIASKMIPKVYGTQFLDDTLAKNREMMQELIDLRVELGKKNKKEF